MIFGIGCDISEVSRFTKILQKKFFKCFLQRVLTKNERNIFNSIKCQKKQAQYLAKRFSAKEAVSKALSCGIGTKLSFLDMQILNDFRGKPFVLFKEKKMKELIPSNKKINWHISLSDTKEIACAYVVAES